MYADTKGKRFYGSDKPILVQPYNKAFFHSKETNVSNKRFIVAHKENMQNPSLPKSIIVEELISSAHKQKRAVFIKDTLQNKHSSSSFSNKKSGNQKTNNLIALLSKSEDIKDQQIIIYTFLNNVKNNSKIFKGICKQLGYFDIKCAALDYHTVLLANLNNQQKEKFIGLSKKLYKFCRIQKYSENIENFTKLLIKMKSLLTAKLSSKLK